MKYKILVIDDDQKLNTLLEEYLVQFGFKVHTATDPQTGFQILKHEEIDIIILDVMLPGMDGFEVLKEIRKSQNTPVIMLTARGEVTDRIVGLELGADDYLPKPFEPRELVARIQTVLRRGSPVSTSQRLKFGSLVVNIDKHLVLLDNKQIDLTNMEFEMLAYFVKNAERVLTREQLMDSLRGFDWDVFDRSIDVLLSRLRRKLNDDPKHPQFIRTVWGKGYQFIGARDESI
jgi:DNA-binding response OmpR family regulator